MVRFGTASLVAVGIALAAPLQATSAVYTITGNGGGSLDGVGWAGDFTITMTGDLANLFSEPDFQINDPLVSAVVDIPTASGLNIIEGTRLGLNLGNLAIFFSRSSFVSDGFDLFDFFIAAPVDLGASFGPVTGTGVFALDQFVDVPTSGGLLTFSRSGDVLFTGVVGGTPAIPEPATWAMQVAGFGLVGAGLRRRRSLVTA
jgi:hypothetical protein